MDASKLARDFEVFAFSPEGLWDPGIPIAASRAGAVGFLNLTYQEAAGPAVAGVERLARLARGRYGVILHGRPGEVERAVLEALPQADTILLTCQEEPALAEMASLCRARARRLGLIVTSEEEGQRASQLGFDLVVAKGHEAGGRVGEETTFVLLQRLLARVHLPVYAWGGVGLATAAACRVAGAAGVVLDWQLALTREAAVPPAFRRRLAAMDGSETAVVREPAGHFFRLYAQAGMSARDEFQALSDRLLEEDVPDPEAWERTIGTLMKEAGTEQRLWATSQDAAFAAPWAAQAPTVARALARLRQHVEEAVRGCVRAETLRADSPLAQSHGTTFPVVQGPMTRVSDVPEFCAAVADGGGLPFLALALMGRTQVRDLLERTRARMGARPWGVGLLGFVNHELRAEQVAAVEEVHPPFAIIAGGRPDQAAALEAHGIATYLHVPSPAMLATFVAEGARRFIFEGRECGGHVGPRSSFVLWETAVRVLLEAGLSVEESARVHVLFAGGIHDSLGGAMVSALAQPLVARGMKVGVLLGTAYLFTEEIVRTGAVLEGFQQVALQTENTALVESGPGHAVRCAPTEFVNTFEREKRRLRREARPAEEVREELEALNLGRLRLAAKGIARRPDLGPGEEPYVRVDDARQRSEGMYMIGQVAALRRSRCTIRGLHEEVCAGAVGRLRRLELDPVVDAEPAEPAPPPLDIAIVGLSCLLPGADTVETFWHNLLSRRDLIGEVPAHRFEADRWYSPDRKARDRISSKWGGFLEAIPFDPLRFGIPPAALRSIEPGQLLALELVDRALRDAGYAEHNPHRERTAVILGVSGGLGELGQKYVFRALLPQFLEDTDEVLREQLPEWTEDSFAGILGNVTAGRISNRFDLGGVNFTVDAACASSLAAVYLACRGLADGTSDLAITGGCDLVQNAFGYLCFATAGALSPRGRSRAFDAGADGIAISEGLAAVVLKRRADAERDGDRIYAVIRAVAGGSDGRSKGLTAPRPEGQARTLRRAYAQAGFSPATVGLFEAHGTGTALGDATECQALAALLRQHGAAFHSSALGSVKSMIGHTKTAAGVTGLIKAALALHHRVLPPTLHVDQPNPRAGLTDGPLYVNTELRPWLRGEHPRRAGVSSFGFGGTNFHAVLEEYDGQPLAQHREPPHRRWPAELFVFAARSPGELTTRVRGFAQEVRRAVEAGAELELANLAFTLQRRLTSAAGPSRLAVVASSVAELMEQLTAAADGLGRTGREARLPAGVYYAEQPLGTATGLAFLFPGQGAQYPDMLRDLAVEFPEVAEAFEQADAAAGSWEGRRLSELIFPPPAFSDEERAHAAAALKATDVAQPALGACGMALYHLLAAFGVRPALTGGHSYGELPALCAAGSLDEVSLYRLSRARGEAMVGPAREGRAADLGTMLAVHADRAAVVRAIEGNPEVWVANHNSPRQTVISGSQQGIARAAAALQAAGLAASPIPVACAFHSPLVALARGPFEQALAGVAFRPPHLPVYSNVSAAPHSSDPEQVRKLLSEQLVREVRFVAQVEAMYAAGTRVFVELGPSRLLAKLVDQVLGDRPHAAVAVQAREQHGLTQLLHALAALIAHGVAVDLERLYEGRALRQLDLRSAEQLARPKLAPHLWLVDGGAAWPAHETRPVPPTPVSLSQASDSVVSANEPERGMAPGTATGRNVHHEARVSPPAAEADAYAQFQETMRRFLETQERVLETYLSGGPVPREDPELPEPSAVSADEGLEEPSLPPLEEDVVVKVEHVEEQTVAGQVEAESEGPAALADRLLEIVSERTGYPAELLNLDADLEAEFGIDSIKRVEIIGAFRRAALPALTEAPAAFMEEMTAARTLRAILDGVARLRGGEKPPPASPVPQPGTEHRSVPAEVIEPAPRCVGTVVEVPPPSADQVPTLRGVVLLTDDGLGIAAALAHRIEREGGRACLLPASILETRAGVLQAVSEIRRQHGPIAALLHLLPLRDAPRFPGISDESWSACADGELKGLLYLLQALAPELGTSQERPVHVAAVSRGGGDFGDDGELEAAHPWRGGLAGMLKCAAREWPHARFRALDLDAIPEANELLRDCLVEGPVEIGHRCGQRLSVQALRADLPGAETATPAVTLDSNSVVLVTGGAQGITGEIAREIAERTRATLVLLGRSPAPSAESSENPRTAGLEDGPELRRRVLEGLREAGAAVSPREVEARVQGLLKARAIRRTLADLRAAGSRVEYVACDVRNGPALEAIVADVRRRHGAINALVHGAGIIEDHFIPDKSPESFDRVVGTKVQPLLTLARVLEPERLRLVLLFSSVSGFFGNAGQVDYAAANEVLNRMARRLRNVWPARVVALNWGPWGGTGMVTPEVARQFQARGVGLIAVPAGRQAVWQELLHQGSEDVRVLLGPGTWVEEASRLAASRAVPVHTPLLAGQAVRRLPGGVVEARVVLDPARQTYLDDHRIDGKPVLPLTVALELMAEAAAAAQSDWHVTQVRDLRLFCGVVLDEGRREIDLRAEPLERGPEGGEWRVRITDPHQSARPLYESLVQLSAHLPEPPPVPSLEPIEEHMRLDPVRAYQDWLFHGPAFQVIEQGHGLGWGGVEATARGGRGGQHNWLIDPLVLDAAPQLALLWSRALHGTSALPNRIGTYHRYGPLGTGPVRLLFRIAPGSDGQVIKATIWFVRDGRVLGLMEGLESTGNARLNRIGKGAHR